MKKFFSCFLLASLAFLMQATVVDQSTALQLVKSLYGERADSLNYYVGSVEKYVNKYYCPVNTDEAASIGWLSGSDEKWLISVSPNPVGNQANVTLALPAKQGSAIRLTSVSQSQPAIELALVPGEKSCILDTSSLTAGAYVVNLLVNGDVADSVQVIKK